MDQRIVRLPSRIGLVTAVLLLLFPGLAWTQEGKGAIAGKVTDQTGAVLRGAQISIEAQDINMVSDEQGLFFVSGLAPGKCTLSISYVGFAPLSKTVDIVAGQRANLDAKLELQSESQTVLVTAPRATAEAEAINVERTADNIVQVLPAEVIRSLPNANMADALGRLPSVTLERDEGEGKYVQVRGTEPRLTNTTIDGMNVPSPESGVRQIKFDAIPADIVESVQVNKTLLANMDGDGIGGSVNLVTKSATDLPTLSLSSMGGYTPVINGRGLTEDTGTVGMRFGQSKKLGILVGGSYDWNGRGIDDIEPVPDVATMANGTTVPWKDGMDIREYQYFRSRWGVGGTTDYRIAPGSDIYVRYLYSDFKNYGNRWVYSLTDNTPGIQLLNPSNVGCGTNNSGTTVAPCTAPPSFNTQLRGPDIGLGSVVLGGSHVLTTTWFFWDLSASRSFDRDTGSSTSFSNTLSSSGCQYDPAGSTSNVYLPRWNAECYTEAYNPANLAMSAINQNAGHTAQLNLQAAVAGAKRYHIGSRSAIIEIGGKFRNEHKFADTYSLTYTPNGNILLSSFPNRLTNTNYYNGGSYKLGYNPDQQDILAFEKANPSDFTVSSTFGQDPSYFGLVEQIGAGYVMSTIDLSTRLRFIAGIRVEGTNDTVNNFAVGNYPCAAPESGTCASINPNRFSGNYVTVLPSTSLRYALDSNSYVRFVYARGLSRPDPQDIAQTLSWSVAGNGANRYSVSFGNANLKAETGDDIDLLYDRYLNSFGFISAGFFYKNLQNPIITRTYELDDYQPPGGPLSNYLATQPVNAGSAWIVGFEAAYLQHFTFLPGMWAGLGLSANYGHTASRTSGIPGRSDNPPLLRTSPNAFNISPTYDRGRLSLRVGISYNQASIYGYQYTDGMPGGVNGPLSDIYFYSHIQLDAQASIRMTRGLSFVIYGLNLNNEVFGFYQGAPQYMIQREYYQPTVAAGFRWSPMRESPAKQKQF
jgi:TonB-dependent receptor